MPDEYGKKDTEEGGSIYQESQIGSDLKMQL
jgi:hypothetical protein